MPEQIAEITPENSNLSIDEKLKSIYEYIDEAEQKKLKNLLGGIENKELAMEIASYISRTFNSESFKGELKGREYTELVYGSLLGLYEICHIYPLTDQDLDTWAIGYADRDTVFTSLHVYLYTLFTRVYEGTDNKNILAMANANSTKITQLLPGTHP